MSIKNIFLFLIVVAGLCACNSKSQNRQKACMDFFVYKEGQPVKVDSCFTSYNSDSLEMIVREVKRKQDELRETFDTRMVFIFVDTLQKEPKDYEYAIALSEAGIINSEVILTNDASIVKEKCKPYNPKNIIVRKNKAGETINSSVEDFFKANTRINYQRVSNEKIGS